MVKYQKITTNYLTNENYIIIPSGHTRFLKSLDIGLIQFLKNIYRKYSDVKVTRAIEEKVT